MSLLIESIKISDGRIYHIEAHQARMDRSRRALFGCREELSLAQHIVIPPECTVGLFKCRVVYGRQIESVEFQPYTIRPVHSLRLVQGDDIEYSFKYQDRSELQTLFNQRGNCDDIIIVKNGLLTDSSYANLVFERAGRLYTPRTPLLKGIKREVYLQRGQLHEADIRPEDLSDFERIHLINAMLDPGECCLKC